MRTTSNIAETRGGEFAGLLKPFPFLSLIRGGMETYNVLRHREPGLVSIADGGHGPEDGALDTLVLNYKQEPLGAVSYVVQTNKNKAPGRNQFGRIDLVITDARFREMGVGRALLMSVMFHLLRNWEDKLYSISCLAAHEAIRKTLESIGFEGHARDGLNYVHEEIKLDSQRAAELADEMAERAEAALMNVNYNFRQQGGNR